MVWETVQDVSTPAFDRIRGNYRVKRSLLRCLDDGVEERVEWRALGPELSLDQDPNRVGCSRSRTRNVVGCREGDEDLTASIVAN